MNYSSTDLCVGRFKYRQVPTSTSAYLNLVVVQSNRADGVHGHFVNSEGRGGNS
jgi:hypothetical protein